MKQLLRFHVMDNNNRCRLEIVRHLICWINKLISYRNQIKTSEKLQQRHRISHVKKLTAELQLHHCTCIKNNLGP